MKSGTSWALQCAWTRQSNSGPANQTGGGSADPTLLCKKTRRTKHRDWLQQNTVRVLWVISYLWGRWGSGDDRTKRSESVPVREREEQDYAIKMRKCHLFLRRECTDHGWSGSGSPSCRRSAPFPAPSMLHSSFHHTTGLPLLFPSSPLLTHLHTLTQPTAAQEVCRTIISAGECRGKRAHCWVFSSGITDACACTHARCHAANEQTLLSRASAIIDLTGLDFTSSLSCLTFRTRTHTLR